MATMSTAMNNNRRATHLLIFPYPAQGHILPLIDLTHQLCLHDFTITILITPKNLLTLSPLLNSHPTSIQTLVLPFPSHPSVPAGIENVKDMGNAGNYHIMAALGKLYKSIIRWFHSHRNPPVAIISDFFLGWTSRLADELKIKRIAFYSSSPFLASVSNYCWNHMDEALSQDVFEISSLPESPSFKKEHLPSMFRMYKQSDPDSEFVKDSMMANVSSWALVFNSFEVIEGEYLDYWKGKTGHDRVFGVGPLNLLDPESTVRVVSETDKESHALKWLDGCPDGSVVYVCFGSQKLLKREQMVALASGLENSNTRFLWVVKTGTAPQIEEGYGSLPDRFEERVAGRGLVVKGWAPQVAILNHRAVGGFLSHCGWNSVLEAVVGGVMILAWPMEADQFVNAKLMVEDIGVGVRVCEGSDSVPDSVELGIIVGESMSQSREWVKVKAKELRDKARTAARSGGSSVRDLEKLTEELKEIDVEDK